MSPAARGWIHKEMGYETAVVRCPRSAPSVAGDPGLLSWRDKPMRVVIDGGQILELVAQQVVVANCQYYGGGMRIAPGAVPDDGLFDVIVVGAVRKLQALSVIGKVYKGTHLIDPRLEGKFQLFHARRVDVSSTEHVLVQLEGEIAGELPASFELIPGCLSLIVP